MEEKRVYSNPDCKRFVAAMERNGLEVRHYRGRWYWEGPAVVSDERGRCGGSSRQDIVRMTKVRLQWDNMAFDFIIYPVARDEGRVVGGDMCPGSGAQSTEEMPPVGYCPECGRRIRLLSGGLESGSGSGHGVFAEHLASRER